MSTWIAVATDADYNRQTVVMGVYGSPEVMKGEELRVELS
jgi:hypothetical protein